MDRKRLYTALVVLGVGVTIASAVALISVQVASAQCGSQASSCKNCHETQAKDPVNNDGTGWHESHAFGDFCYICHGGNSQSLDETAAHTGMVDPLSDVQAACGQCHPNDLQAKAAVYAAKLGTPVGAAAPASSPAPTGTPTPAAAGSPVPTAAMQPEAGAQPAVTPGSSDLVDYVQRYNQQVLHREPTNLGDVILLVLIGAMVVGGGGMVILRERLVSISFKETKPVAGEYPTDVVDMVPDLAKLKPGARNSLRRLLKRPDAAASLLDAVDKLAQGKDED